MKKTIAILSLVLSWSSLAIDACREELKKSLCYTSEKQHWLIYTGPFKSRTLKEFQNRECEQFPIERERVILSIYDNLHPKVQQAFCHTRRVFLVKDAYHYGGRVTSFYDEETIRFKTVDGIVNFSGQQDGYVLEISEPARFKGESGVDFKSRVTWARFLDQEKAKQDLSIEWDIGEIEDQHEALATTIVHEIGHMLSRANNLYQSFAHEEDTHWSNFSWSFENGLLELKEDDFSGVWFSIKNKEISHFEIDEMLNYQKSAGEPTLYAASNPEESFAEHFMFYFYPSFKMLDKGEVVFDLESLYADKESIFSKKKDFISKLLDKEDPYIPLDANHTKVYSIY